MDDCLVLVQLELDELYPSVSKPIRFEVEHQDMLFTFPPTKPMDSTRYNCYVWLKEVSGCAYHCNAHS